MSEPVIELRGVTKRFLSRKGAVTALEDVNIRVCGGEIFGIIGFSGAGKSTLMRVINALETPTSGEVRVLGKRADRLKGRELRVLRKQTGMIFQGFNLLESKTVFDNVALPLVLNHEDKTGIRARVGELLEFVGLAGKARAHPRQLSGGQKQRVGIARALATEPKILLCDEATSALDPETTEAILSLLLRVNRELNVTILFVTHMIDVIRRICDKVAVMENGRVIEQGSTLEVFSAPRTAVGARFVSSVIPSSIPRSILAGLRSEIRPYKLIRFRFNDATATDDVIWQINTRFPAVRTNVLFASVTELKGQILSVIILQAVGEDVAIEEIGRYLTASGVTWEYVDL